jgi:hypothetical protein
VTASFQISRLESLIRRLNRQNRPGHDFLSEEIGFCGACKTHSSRNSGVKQGFGISLNKNVLRRKILCISSSDRRSSARIQVDRYNWKAQNTPRG